MSENLAYKYEEESLEELIDGQVVAMAPSPTVDHHQIAFNIASIFSAYLKGKKCRAFGDGVDLYLTEKDRFIPDGMVVCDPDKIKFNGVHGAPDLVVEVRSPSTAKRDRGYKMRVYAQCGVKEYWLVNPADRSLETYLLENGEMVLQEIYTLYPDYMVEAMSEAERAALVTKFQCSLFDDLTIHLEDVFERVE